MNPPINQNSIEDLLHEVQEKADSRDYVGALAVLEIVRSSDPGSIYLAALKRQIEPMFMLAEKGELSDERRDELMDPVPGIIQCVIRENLRQGRSATATSLPAEEPSQAEQEIPSPGAEERKETGEAPASPSPDPQKELEALKLLYFQRASKFVMKGEYEQALAEVRRVFVVDPENMIAREYATRVELLIDHARRLTSPPPEAVPVRAEEPPLTEQMFPPANTPPVQQESTQEHGRRSTAWDDDFLAPASVSKMPERRGAPSSSRQTVAYGDSLAVALKPSAPPQEVEHPAPVRRSSGKKLILIVALAVAVIGGGSLAVFSRGSTPGNQLAQRANGTSQPAEDRQMPPASGTVAAPQEQPAQQQAPAQMTSENAPVMGTDVRRSSSEEKATTESPRREAVRESAPPVEQKPARRASAVEGSEPAPTGSTLAESKPAPAEPAPASPPAFIPVEKEPQIVKLEKPQFPSFVWNSGMEGQVVVKVLIDADGKPIDTQILKSTNTVFEDGVIQAVMKSQFSPAQMGQGPVSAWLTIPFKFRQPK